MTREHVDTEAGASNGPELVAELRRRGLEVPCSRVPCYDRDGIEVKRGIYHVTECGVLKSAEKGFSTRKLAVNASKDGYPKNEICRQEADSRDRRQTVGTGGFSNKTTLHNA